MNTDENLKLFVKAIINNADMNKMISNIAREVVNGTRDALPEEFADLFTLQIVTRPSGSKYGILDFA